MTFMVMHYTERDQPALLYILPCQVFVYLLAAFGRMEFVKMIKYDEEQAENVVEGTTKKDEDKK